MLLTCNDDKINEKELEEVKSHIKTRLSGHNFISKSRFL